MVVVVVVDAEFLFRRGTDRELGGLRGGRNRGRKNLVEKVGCTKRKEEKPQEYEKEKAELEKIETAEVKGEDMGVGKGVPTVFYG